MTTRIPISIEEMFNIVTPAPGLDDTVANIEDKKNFPDLEPEKTGSQNGTAETPTWGTTNVTNLNCTVKSTTGTDTSPHSTQCPESPTVVQIGNGCGDQKEDESSSNKISSEKDKKLKESDAADGGNIKGNNNATYVQITFLNSKMEEDNFMVCEHWCDFITDALKLARANANILPVENRKEYRWISNYTPLHYAVSKHNVKMCEFLLEAPECSTYFRKFVHVIDDFGEKPIDHLCNSKGKIPTSKQGLADYLIYFMNLTRADPNCPREIMYQDIKLNGPLHLRKTKEESIDMSKLVDASGQQIEIASGESGPDLTNIMTAFEVESALPQEMRKNFKIVAKSGFDNYTGGWTKGESPLHWAASRGKVDICRMLVLVLKANPEAEDDKGRSAIKCAKMKKHHGLAKMLHTLEFPIERDAEMKKKKEESRKRGNVTVAPTLKRRVEEV